MRIFWKSALLINDMLQNVIWILQSNHCGIDKSQKLLFTVCLKKQTNKHLGDVLLDIDDMLSSISSLC